jgi:hypothetical protein
MVVIRRTLTCQPDNAAAETSTLRLWQKIAQPHWEHFPHKADIGVHGFGANREQIFEQTALALTSVIVDLGKIEPRAV